MNKLHGVVAFVAGLVMSFQGDNASANSSVSGAICQPVSTNSAGTLESRAWGATNSSFTAEIVVACPMPIDHAVGTPQFDVQVTDRTTIASVDCSGAVQDVTGTVVASSAWVSSNVAGTGKSKLQIVVPAPADTWTNAYTVVCAIPASQGINGNSVIESFRVF